MEDDWDDDAEIAEDAPKRKRGRPKGSFSKASKAQIDRVTSDGGLSPLEYLASIYQNAAEDQKLRIEAAKAAAPYVHARLASTDVKAALSAREVSQEEWLDSLN